MENEDRSMLGMKIRSNPDNGFLCVSDLIGICVLFRANNNLGQVNVKSSINAATFKIHLYYHLVIRGAISCSLLDYNREIGEIGTIKYLKNIGFWKTTGARHTKLSMCDSSIFKMVAKSIFGTSYFYVEPKWLSEINADISVMINRSESIERGFVDMIVDKIGFLADEIIPQFIIDNSRYDLYVNILGNKLLFEYNETKHSIDKVIIINDRIKTLLAASRGYKLINVSEGMENESLVELRNILTKK